MPQKVSVAIIDSFLKKILCMSGLLYQQSSTELSFLLLGTVHQGAYICIYLTYQKFHVQDFYLGLFKYSHVFTEFLIHFHALLF